MQTNFVKWMRYLLSWRLAWLKVYVKRTAVNLSFFNTNRSHMVLTIKTKCIHFLWLVTLKSAHYRLTCNTQNLQIGFFFSVLSRMQTCVFSFRGPQPDKFGRDFFQSPQENYFKHPSIYGKSANKPCKHLPRSSSQHIYLRSARQCPFSYNFSGNFVNL